MRAAFSVARHKATATKKKAAPESVRLFFEEGGSRGTCPATTLGLATATVQHGQARDQGADQAADNRE
jgi:hypothetical protein